MIARGLRTAHRLLLPAPCTHKAARVYANSPTCASSTLRPSSSFMDSKRQGHCIIPAAVTTCIL
eukprot:1158615-Pelagomonas_calceolata.AAC.1